jgi:hypothetical protein
MNKKPIFILLIFVLSSVSYCILVFTIGPIQYWLPYHIQPKTIREKLVNLEVLLIRPADLPGPWKDDGGPNYEIGYSNMDDGESNLSMAMIKNNEESLRQHVLQYRNKLAAKVRYQEIFSEGKKIFGKDDEFGKVLKLSHILKLGDQNDIICQERIKSKKTYCDIFIRIDEFVAHSKFGVFERDISLEDLEEKVNYYNQLAYSKFVYAGLVGQE